MGALTGLIEHMDWMSMLLFLMSGAACLICLTVHELAHGLAAYRLGDPTAKINGRLTLNPLSHIDWIGLFLLMAAGVGWAKPVAGGSAELPPSPAGYGPHRPGGSGLQLPAGAGRRWGRARCCCASGAGAVPGPIFCCSCASWRC